MKTQAVDPKALVFSPWNVNSVSPENQKKLEESIRRNGIFRPVVVREREDGELEVIAGEHTTRAAITLKHKTIDVYNLGPISEAQAKEISIIDNQHYGSEDAFGLAALLKELDTDVEAFLPMSDADLKAIFKSTSINFDDLELPDDEPATETREDVTADLGSAPVTHQIMRVKVPIADAEFVTRCIETVAKRQGFTGPDSMMNAGDALLWICQNQASA